MTMTGPLQGSRLFDSPVVRFKVLAVSASIGEPINVEQIAKTFPNVHYNPKSSKLVFSNLNPATFPGTIIIYGLGRIECLHCRSEEQARRTILEVIRQLKWGRIPIRYEPSFEVDVDAEVFFGRGIDIASLPERIPDSLYAHRVGPYSSSAPISVQGRYNRAGTLVQLASQDEVGKAIDEISGVSINPSERAKLRRSGALHASYCRLRESPIVARMFRDLDVDGNMCMVGYAQLFGTKSELQAQESARNMEKMLEEAGLFGPLTPRDKIPSSDEDPEIFDYFFVDDP
jgi:transcription factor TFIID (TATA-binding protein)